jgi:hypothetical protein
MLSFVEGPERASSQAIHSFASHSTLKIIDKATSFDVGSFPTLSLILSKPSIEMTPPLYSPDGVPWVDIDPDIVEAYFGEVYFTRRAAPANEEKPENSSWKNMDRGLVNSTRLVPTLSCSLTD